LKVVKFCHLETGSHWFDSTITWPLPRRPVVEAVGQENQSVPLLVLADGATSPHRTGTHEGRVFIADKDKILATLSERHGFPDPHP